MLKVKIDSLSDALYQSFDEYLKFILPHEIYTDLRIVSSLGYFRVYSLSGIFYPPFFKCTIFSSDFLFLGVVYDEKKGFYASFKYSGIYE